MKKAKSKMKRCVCPEHDAITVSSATDGADQDQDVSKKKLLSVKSKTVPMWAMRVLKISDKRFDRYLCKGCLEYAKLQAKVINYISWVNYGSNKNGLSTCSSRWAEHV